MIQIPANLINRYPAFIEQRGVEAGQHRYYVKWLRYYLDFCHKYKLIQTENESLSAFMGKLKEKNRLKTLESRRIMPSLFFMNWSIAPVEKYRTAHPVAAPLHWDAFIEDFFSLYSARDD